MKAKLMSAVLAYVLFSNVSFAAVWVTCVCTKYVLNKDRQLVLDTEELYKTTNLKEVQECNNSSDPNMKAPEIKKHHFNCMPVAKEALLYPTEE